MKSVTYYLKAIRRKCGVLKHRLGVYFTALKIALWKTFNKNGVFLILTPTHGNLGDHAIALSEMELFSEANFKYYEVTNSILLKLQKQKLLHCFNGNKIVVNGGGNLGTLWMSAENLFRDIIIKNPKSAIYCFPNTVFYEDTDFGREELKKSIEIYNSHKNLKIYAREETSYNFMKPIYNSVELVPDMVLRLKPQVNGKERNGCLLLLRSDIEKTLTEEETEKLNNTVNSFFNDVTYSDTVLGYGINTTEREKELNKKFNQIAAAKLVVTDRLHGFVFSAICGTPCIVLNSKSPKVKGCYKWIENLDYIKFCDNIDDLPEIIKSMPKEGNYDNSHLLPYYEILKNDLLNI